MTLYYDGKAVGKGRVDQTQPMGYSADEAVSPLDPWSQQSV